MPQTDLTETQASNYNKEFVYLLLLKRMITTEGGLPIGVERVCLLSESETCTGEQVCVPLCLGGGWRRLPTIRNVSERIVEFLVEDFYTTPYMYK